MFPDLLRDDVFRLETRSLWLRWPRHADAAAIARQAGDKDVAEMTAVMPHPYPPGEAERFVFSARADNTAGTRLTFAIAPKRRPNDLVGVIGVREAKPGRPQLGYWIGRAHWGEGLASEAAEAVVDAVFRLTELDVLYASARVDNPASRRVLERAGFAHTSSGREFFPLRGGELLLDRFELDRGAWTKLRPLAAKGVDAARAGPPPAFPGRSPGLAMAAE
jgi:RimJ/RimL family protein N-acetyltransferase